MYSTGPISAGGAFTGDFGIIRGAPTDQISAEIERDREIMVQRPGMRQKHVPLRIERESGQVFCGGRYLFDRYEDSLDYLRWVKNEFVLGGVPFPERPYFVDPVFLAWRVIGAHDFADLHSHAAVRFERWALADRGSSNRLERLWAPVQDDARRRDLASVWLLYSEERNEAGLVTVMKRSSPALPQELDWESIERLEAQESIAARIHREGWGEKVFDRAGWVWTIWTPRAQQGTPSLWPNSPPLPVPVPAAL